MRGCVPERIDYIGIEGRGEMHLKNLLQVLPNEGRPRRVELLAGTPVTRQGSEDKTPAVAVKRL